MRDWLIKLRTESRSKTASKIGISQSMYTKIERGEKNPSLDVAIKIANVMKFNMNMWNKQG